jgi:hypothetical protein
MADTHFNRAEVLLNHGIRVEVTGDWQLTVNHAGDSWSFDTQQLVDPDKAGWQAFRKAYCYLSPDRTVLTWHAGTGWLGFNTNLTVLDVQALRMDEKEKDAKIKITSAVHIATATSTVPRFFLALTPVGLQSLDREASEPDESGAINLPPEVVESLRATAQQ